MWEAKPLLSQSLQTVWSLELCKVMVLAAVGPIGSGALKGCSDRSYWPRLRSEQ